MFPFFASALLAGTYIYLIYRQRPRPGLGASVMWLVFGLVVGFAVASIDFFIGLSTGRVQDVEQYFEWEYPQYALSCMALSLGLFALLRGTDRLGFLPALLVAIAGSLWINSAGLFWRMRLFVRWGEFELDQFLVALFDIDRLSASYFWQGVAIYGVASALFILIVYPRAALRRQSGDLHTNREVLVRFNSSSNEPARLLMAMAAAGRLPMAKKLEQQAEHPCQAEPFSLDVDPEDLMRVAKKAKEDNRRYRMMYFGLGVVAVISAVAEFPIGFVIAIFLAGCIAFQQRRHEREQLVPSYQPTSFTAPTPPDGDEALQNLVVYSGYDPFAQFGVRFGSWVLMVDTKRPKQDDMTSGQTVRPDIAEIEKRIASNITKGGQIEGTPRPLYFVQGANIPEDIKRKGAIKPRLMLGLGKFEAHADNPDSPMRRYLWIRKSIWGREITISYFVRLFWHGDDLDLEIQGVIMPPVAPRFRWVDGFAPLGFWGVVFDFIGSLIMGAAQLAWVPIYYFIRIQEELAKALGAEARARRRAEKSVERTANYDFGAPASVRREVADFGPVQYFQQMDRRAAEAAFAGRVMRSFIDYLDECNIDTSELRDQRTTLLNQGIVVQNGDVKADNVAVGAGSRIKAMGQRARSTVGTGK